MESKLLQTAASSSVVRLSASQQEIEVPAGSSIYAIQQTGIEQEYTFHLRHPHSEVHIIGAIHAVNEEIPHLVTKVIHHASNTRADTLIRTLAEDKAKPHYEGLIKIDPGAQNCESYLNHHSLLLGESAASRTTPSLEIGANEVKCSHAATIRTITDADVFYLRARGIPAEEARQLLIEAFLRDVQI